MSSTKEELLEMKEIVIKILSHTDEKPSKIFVGYDYFEAKYGSMSTSNPKIVIEWKRNDEIY